MKQSKRTFKFTLLAISDSGKPTVKEFKEGMGAGVLATQELEFNLTKKEYDSVMFAVSLDRKMDAFKDQMIRVEVEEIT